MAYIGKEPGSGLRGRFVYTATAGQTSFTGSDSLGRTLTYTDSEYTDVFLNGVKLDKTDYTATSGTSIVLDSGATAGDTLEILAFDTFGLFSGEFAQDVSVSGDLTVDGTTLHVDSTNNRVGIGTSSPDSSITVSGASKVFSTATNNSITTSVNTSSNYAQTITLNDVGLAFDNNSSIRGYAFGNNGSERMRIQSGGGISFNGDTAAANALDDYEEGTFTPVFTRASSGFSTTPTYSTQEGAYVKIGSLVHAEIEIRFANSFSGGSGNYLVSNLPFNNSGMSNLEGISWGLMTIFNHTWSFSNTYAYLSGTDVHFGSGMGLASNTTSQYLTFTIQYRVA